MDNGVKIAWATDLHLDFKEGNTSFFDDVLFAGADAVFLTGDLATASDVGGYLMDMELKWNVPIYFVLGNHDYYHGSFKQVRSEMESLTHAVDNLYWMPEAGVVELTKDVCVVGVDGWYDGRYGFSDPPKLIMNDWGVIDELKEFKHNHTLLLLELQAIADNEAALAKIFIADAVKKYSTVYFLTHVPPWPKASWHTYHHSDNTWIPWFTSKAMGDVLEEAADKYPHVNFEVLCGHSHSSGELLIKKNLRCRTGSAEYSNPRIADMIYVKSY